jgi:hypothetical protein
MPQTPCQVWNSQNRPKPYSVPGMKQSTQAANICTSDQKWAGRNRHTSPGMRQVCKAGSALQRTVKPATTCTKCQLWDRQNRTQPQFIPGRRQRRKVIIVPYSPQRDNQDRQETIVTRVIPSREIWIIGTNSHLDKYPGKNVRDCQQATIIISKYSLPKWVGHPICFFSAVVSTSPFLS